MGPTLPRIGELPGEHVDQIRGPQQAGEGRALWPVVEISGHDDEIALEVVAMENPCDPVCLGLSARVAARLGAVALALEVVHQYE